MATHYNVHVIHIMFKHDKQDYPPNMSHTTDKLMDKQMDKTIA